MTAELERSIGQFAGSQASRERTARRYAWPTAEQRKAGSTYGGRGECGRQQEEKLVVDLIPLLMISVATKRVAQLHFEGSGDDLSRTRGAASP